MKEKLKPFSYLFGVLILSVFVLFGVITISYTESSVTFFIGCLALLWCYSHLIYIVIEKAPYSFGEKILRFKPYWWLMGFITLIICAIPSFSPVESVSSSTSFGIYTTMMMLSTAMYFVKKFYGDSIVEFFKKGEQFLQYHWFGRLKPFWVSLINENTADEALNDSVLMFKRILPIALLIFAMPAIEPGISYMDSNIAFIILSYSCAWLVQVYESEKNMYASIAIICVWLLVFSLLFYSDGSLTVFLGFLIVFYYYPKVLSFASTLMISLSALAYGVLSTAIPQATSEFGFFAGLVELFYNAPMLFASPAIADMVIIWALALITSGVIHFRPVLKELS